MRKERTGSKGVDVDEWDSRNQGKVITRAQTPVRPPSPQVESAQTLSPQALTDLATEGINAVNDAIREEFRDRYYGFERHPQDIPEVKP